MGRGKKSIFTLTVAIIQILVNAMIVYSQLFKNNLSVRNYFLCLKSISLHFTLVFIIFISKKIYKGINMVTQGIFHHRFCKIFLNVSSLFSWLLSNKLIENGDWDNKKLI